MPLLLSLGKKKPKESRAARKENRAQKKAAITELTARKSNLEKDKAQAAKDADNTKGIKGEDPFSFGEIYRAKPKTTIKTIPYKKMHPGDILELPNGKYSKTYTFSDINYISARDSEQLRILAEYVRFLNSMPSNTYIQVSIVNNALPKEEVYRAVLLDDDTANEFICPIFGISLKDEFNSILRGFLDKGINNRRRDKYISITIAQDEPKDALRRFADLETQMSHRFKQISPECNLRPLSNDERARMLAQIFRGADIPLANLSDSDFEYMNEKAYISPDDFTFSKNHFSMSTITSPTGERFAKCLFLRDIPLDMTDELINNLMETQIEMVLSINIKPIDISKAKEKVQNKILAYQEKQINTQMKMVKKNYFGDVDKIMPTPLKNAMESTEKYEDILTNKKQGMFIFNLVLMFMADSEDDLETKENTLKNKANELLCQFGILGYQQERGMHSVLPIGFNNLSIKRSIHSEGLGIFMPFDRQPTIQKGGFFYSIHADTKQAIVINANELKSPSGFILGSSGSGKGMFYKPIIANILFATNDDIICIDPENELGRFIEAFKGQNIELSTASHDRVNPFDIPVDDEEFRLNRKTATTLKLDLILSIISAMTQGEAVVEVRTTVDRILKKIYEPFQASKDPRDIPTFKHFDAELAKYNGQIEMWLRNAMGIFVDGSWDMFSAPTNVHTNNRLICYNTSALSEDLKPVASFIMFDAIWNRVTKNRNTGKNTWIFVDEVHLVFQSDEDIRRVEGMYRRIRKYDGRITSITQNTKDLIRWEAAESMLRNSDFIAVLNQKDKDLERIQEILMIPDVLMPHITNAGKGEGIIFAENMLIPFSNLFPDNTRLYELMTTSSKELAVILEREREARKAPASNG
jgi:type IV secretory pathway VirB4 component